MHIRFSFTIRVSEAQRRKIILGLLKGSFVNGILDSEEFNFY